MEKNITTSRVVEWKLVSLAKKYDPIAKAIEELKDLATLLVTKLIGFLETYEQNWAAWQKLIGEPISV